jgi:NAD(P)-dependent dehydrogenase (short-subunit alcohol dehydrogenase family)
MLNGKVVLITGASGGLGQSVTRAFLEAGARVYGVSRSISQADVNHKGFVALAADIKDAGQARAVVSKIVAQGDGADAWIHLVGGFAGGSRVDETEDSAFARMIDLNVRSFLHLAQAAVPVMRKQGKGRVLAIGSRAAVEPASGIGAYAASKAALVSLVRTIALENKDRGITANVILPGTMDTPANRAAMPDADPRTWVQPAQVASLLVHLASDSASQINGAVIPVYGTEI